MRTLSRSAPLSRSPRRLVAALGALAALAAACDPPRGGGETSAPAASSASPAPSASGSVAPSPAASAEAAAADAGPAREIAGAQQILVAYKGAEGAPKEVTRSKADAKKRADDALKKVKDGKVPFEQLAKDLSDDGSRATGGQIGNFERNAMPRAFSDVAFALKVGDTSDVVESPRGFHIIRRTK